LRQFTNGLTSNYNNYSAAELEKALQSWVEPYPKPIILNHDLNTEPIGRVIAAKMDKEEDGSPFVRLQIAITDPVAAQKVLDKRYLTGSVGGRAGKAVCSISGDDLASESDNGRPKVAKYRRGQVYKGKLAYIDMQDISFKEYSFVNQPADGKSSVRSTSVISDKDGKPNSEGWVAKSSAFVLSMNEEDIYSVEEHDSLFKNMKKKESKPMYLHLKGAFLTALAFQESENTHNNAVSLLSSEEAVNNTDLQENSNMKDRNQEEDILAVTEELSEDLSSIAAGKTEESEGGEEEAPEAPAEGGEEAGAETAGEEKSDDDTEKADEQAEEAVDSEQAAESEEPEADEEKAEGDQEPESADEDLSDKAEQPAEQDNDVLDKVKALEEENAKLKAALHRILVERVVDAKITAGVEAAEQRDELIESHLARTASSLADSLRDLAKMPTRKSRHSDAPEIHNESAAVANEENVATIDEDNEVQESKEEVSLEQVFVDALMGRRKL
jgi:hypothetical protein